MQDRYAGDIGDFGKYGLLRWLCRSDEHGAAFRLGVFWYLFDGKDAAAPNDGKHTEYLCKPNPKEKRLCICDPELFQVMGEIVYGERSVAAVEKKGVLTPSTLFFSKGLNFNWTPQRERDAVRRKWLDDGLQAVKATDLVFVDPDNGLEVPKTKPLSNKGPKFAYYDDIRPCWERGQSLVIYQHIDRTSCAEKQIAQRCAALHRELPGAMLVPLRFRRRSSRVYFVVSQPEHVDRMEARIRTFLESPWGAGKSPHFEWAAC